MTTLEAIFSIASGLAAVGWLLLLVVPRHPAAQLVSGVVLPLVLAGLYAVLVAVYAGESEGGFGTLADVAKLFLHPGALLAGWVHYLAFDLFIGAWEVRDSIRHDISRLAVAPCLILTFLLGPIGLLTYFVIRTIRLRQVSLP